GVTELNEGGTDWWCAHRDGHRCWAVVDYTVRLVAGRTARLRLVPDGFVRWPGNVIDQTRPRRQRLRRDHSRARRHHGPTRFVEFLGPGVLPPGEVLLHHIRR